MPRAARIVEGGSIYHVLNRGNDRKQIFWKPSDYLAFLTLLVEGLKHASVEVMAFCLMPNHWHLVLRPQGSKDLSAYLGWVTNTHVKRYREHYHTTGQGHVYQGRYKSFVTQQDFHLLIVMRYVEGNALRAGLVTRAEQWRWSSVAAEAPPQVHELLTPWPIDRPENWLNLVNEIPPKSQLQQLRQSVNRERPFGADLWVAATAARLRLPFTFRTRRDQREPTPSPSNSADSLSPAPDRMPVKHCMAGIAGEWRVTVTLVTGVCHFTVVRRPERLEQRVAGGGIDQLRRREHADMPVGKAEVGAAFDVLRRAISAVGAAAVTREVDLRANQAETRPQV